MPDLGDLRRATAQANAQAAVAAAQAAQLNRELAAARERLRGLHAVGDSAAAQAAALRIEELTAARKQVAAARAAAAGRFRDDLDQLLHPDLELEGDIPLVLLPVRVEVRYTPDQTALRVRIFHDAVHAESLDEGLSETERAAGSAYWTAVWPSGNTQEPWTALIVAVGARRAPWVAQALRPTNLGQRPAAAPEFPDNAQPAARQAVARTLPDRFYVRVEQAGAAPQTHPGRAIPDELPVGLADRDELTALSVDGDDTPLIDESLRWLVDYAEAERVGMALTVPLQMPGEAVTRLLVFGVRAALEPAAGAARLERLIRSHRFTDGAQFLAQGSPTNNTESVRSEWSKRTPPGAPTLDIQSAGPGTNAAVTAAALGIDPGLIATLPGADGQEQAHAEAFNAALWTTTWGDAIEHLTPQGRADQDKRLDNASLDAVRDHWVDHVRGRGPLPALRLGRQPYGVLPLVVTGSSFKPLVGGFVEDRLVPFLDQQLRWIWREGVGEVPTVMNQPLDAALPLILGTDAVLRGLRVRTALSPDPVLGTMLGLTLPNLGAGKARQQVNKALLLLTGVSQDALDSDGHLLGKKTRTLALPLAHESDPEFIASLLDDDPANRPAESVLQVLLAHAAAIERHDRESLAPPRYRDALRACVTESQVDVNRQLLVQAMASIEERGHDDALLADAAAHVAEQVGRLDRRMIADRNPIPAIAAESVIQQIAGREPRVELLRDAVGMQLVGEYFQRHRWGARFRQSLETIAKIETVAERELLLKETLDCCSHRLDAWINAAASRRLADLRARGAQGCFLGAYGWLENIQPRPPKPAGQVDGRDVLHDPLDGGFIHAPGITHAAAAGVLRSGRLTHRRGDPNDEALEIDLSSTRVRDAITLLDGMRHQPLGALLGYRLERRLHERSGGALELDRFIYVLRTLAPLRAGKLTDPDQPAQESVAASDVVDGLRLLELDPGVITAKLTSGPDDQRYIVPPDAWVPPRPGEAEAVLAAIAELEQTHDAVADLLLAESVYQAVSGNAPRAAAVLDLLGAGEAAPQPPEVVRTPTSGITIQHRVAIVVPDPIGPPAPGWDAGTPRAVAEPRLEAWAAAALGDPGALAGRGLSALDVLYDSDGDNVSASSLAGRVPDVEGLAPIWELAGMLRGLLVAGRAFDVNDAGRPVVQGETGRAWDAAEILARATVAMDGLAAAIAAPDPIAELVRFGVRSPTPVDATLHAQERAASASALVEAAKARLEAARSLLAKANAAAGKAAAELAAQAIGAVFGSGFLAVPVLGPVPVGESDLWAGGAGEAGVRPRPGADIRPWLARTGVFRAQTSAFGETLLVREAFGQRPTLRVVQTPVGGYTTWVGLPFPDARPPQVPMVSAVLEVAGSGDHTGAIAGVVLDEWTEVVPRRLVRDDPRTPEVEAELVDVTTTGVAVNANAPGARPPQTILIGLSADGAAWNGERLASLLDEALALARMRTVTLQDLPFAGAYLPALYFRDWSLQGEPTIDWDVVSQRFDPNLTLSYLAVEQ